MAWGGNEENSTPFVCSNHLVTQIHSEGGTGENQRIDPHLNFGIFHRKQ